LFISLFSTRYVLQNRYNHYWQFSACNIIIPSANETYDLVTALYVTVLLIKPSANYTLGH